MSRDDIIRMAALAGWEMDDSCVLEPQVVWYISQGQLESFAALVAAAEREECAKVCEERLLDKANCTAEQMYELQKKSIAAAIRARGHL
jgi:hypothetical protein